ncbi:hypothetical protein Taro_047111 [Colocasia esculenta]|uniref:Uncharacterized protein n=1 Tax=Colocasia esculenta TaxID=4460 RepID=A0A843X514_COLES|nr:hypothetical protein [Colocasia esculenta]
MNYTKSTRFPPDLSPPHVPGSSHELPSTIRSGGNRQRQKWRERKERRRRSFCSRVALFLQLGCTNTGVARLAWNGSR